MKKKIVIGCVVLAVVIVGFVIFRPKSFSKECSKTMSSLTSYTLMGEMELNKGEDIKSYILEVNYKKGEEDDYYKVSLFDKNLNQEQILLRNSEGVFVVTPSLNQIFKFEGEWPLNSPKPYLIQTMYDVMNNDEAEISESKQGAEIISPVSYPNNKTYKRQQMRFDSEAKPQLVEIFDEDNTVQLRLIFDKVEYNNDVKDDIFKTPGNIESTVASLQISNEDLPLYPVSVFDSKLVSRNVMEVNGEKRHILEFAGDKNYTLVETVKTAQEETQTVFMPQEIIDTIEMIGFYDGASMSAYHQNVEMTIFSSDLSPEEMMSVLSSMQVAVMK